MPYRSPFFKPAAKTERSRTLQSDAGVELATDVALDVAQTLKTDLDPEDTAPRYVPITTPLHSLPTTSIELEKHIETIIERTVPLENTTRGLSWLKFSRKQTTITTTRQDTPPSSPLSTSSKSSLPKRVILGVKRSLLPPTSNKLVEALQTGQEVVAVKDEIVTQSLQKIAGATLISSRIGSAQVRVILEPIQVGFLRTDPNIEGGSKMRPVYVLTISCEFMSAQKCTIEDARVEAFFSLPQDDIVPSSPTTEMKTPLSDKNGVDTTNISSKDTAASASKSQLRTTPIVCKRQPFKYSNQAPVALRGAPQIHSIAPIQHKDQLDIFPVQRGFKLAPVIPIGGNSASIGEITRAAQETRRYQCDVKGITPTSLSSDDTALWEISANPKRPDGIPQRLKFVALVGHHGESHKPLVVTVSVRWALRSIVPNSMRAIFGWQDTSNAEFPFRFDGMLDKALYQVSGEQKALDAILKDVWVDEHVESEKPKK